MKKKKAWTITKLIAIGALAVIGLLLWIMFGAVLLFSTGNIFGASFAMLTAPFFIVLVALLIDQVGAVTIYQILFFFMHLPLPHIVPPIILAVTMPIRGLIADILYFLLGKRSKALFAFVAGAVFNLGICLESIIVYFSIGMPTTENIPAIIVTPIGLTVTTFIVALVGGLAGYAGLLVYKKLSKTAVVRRIQA